MIDTLFNARVSLISAAGLISLAGCNNSSRPGSSASPKAVEASGVTHVANQTQRNVMDFPTGDRATSVLEVEQVSPREVRAGSEYTYQVNVTNRTDRPISNVVLRATQPEGLRMSEVGNSGPTTRPDANGWLSYNIGTLGPRETRTLNFAGTPTGSESIRQTYDVAYEQKMTTAVNVTAPALRLVKEAPRDVDVCQPIVWNYSVTNTGTGVARNVALRDTLPQGLATTDGQNVVAADLGDIPTGETRTAIARLKASRSGTYASAATVHSDAGDAKSETITTRAHQPKLDLSVKAPETEYLGKPVNYRIVVTNNGDAPANKTTLHFNTPESAKINQLADADGAPIPAGDPSTGYVLGTIEAGKSRAINLTVLPNQAGVLNVGSVASAQCATEVTQSAQTTLQTVAALLLEAVDVQDPVKVGDNVIYKIKVTNQGNGPDSNIRVSAQLPDGEQYVKAAGISEVSNEGQTINFAPIRTLAAKESATWEVTAKAVQAGDVQFKVKVTSDSVKVPAEKTEATKLY